MFFNKFCVLALCICAVSAHTLIKREFPSAESDLDYVSARKNFGIIHPQSAVGKCSDADPCVNGGLCKDNLCHCLSGTTGDKCEIVEACNSRYDLYVMCGYVPGLKCAFNATDLTAYCSCEDEKEGYDVNLKSCRAKCQEDSNCTNGGVCVNELCQCLPGTKGDKCEIIENCTTASDVYELCNDYLARCEYNQTTHRAYCTCILPEEYAYDTKASKCKKCDCGLNSHGCNFTDGIKTCNCSWGYGQDAYGKCIVARCDCGPNGECFFKGWDTFCVCNDGYEEINHRCEAKLGTSISPPISGKTSSVAGSTHTGTTGKLGTSISPPVSGKTSSVPGSTHAGITGSGISSTQESSTKSPPLQQTTDEKSWRTGCIILGLLLGMCLIGLGFGVYKLRTRRHGSIQESRSLTSSRS